MCTCVGVGKYLKTLQCYFVTFFTELQSDIFLEGNRGGKGNKGDYFLVVKLFGGKR